MGDGGKKESGAGGVDKETTFNPRWFGYFGLLVFSVANFASVIDARTFQGRGERAFSISIGAFSSTLCSVVLLFDRMPYLQKIFDFKEYLDGKLEGWVLLFLVVLWLTGVCIMTRADGIAFKALNIYFSSWFSLGMSLYTLDSWSASKDILSFQELTHLSATLSSWYVLLVSSFVTMASAAQIHSKDEYKSRADTSFAVASGCLSLLVAVNAILLHYKIVRFFNIKPGNFVELTTAMLLNLLWMITVGVVTKDGGVAATITGTNCYDDQNGNISTDLPGSNLFLSTWTALFSSFSITIKWKSARALRFAQAQETQRRKEEKEAAKENDTDDMPDDV